MSGRRCESRTLEVYAIGHSTRPLEEFLRMLQEAGVVTLADIRTVPRSRKNPQYDRATLPQALARAGIGYCHLPRLGGLRRGLGEASPNKGWRNASFRGYADYMLDSGFEGGLDELLELARAGPLAVMCAEAVPWRCHRSLVADALLARGIPVTHLMGPGKNSPHRLTPFARLEGALVTYPEQPG